MTKPESTKEKNNPIRGIVKKVKDFVSPVRKSTYHRVKKERNELLKNRNQDNTNLTEQGQSIITPPPPPPHTKKIKKK